MKYKILVLDLDGTLTNKKKEITALIVKNHLFSLVDLVCIYDNITL